MHHTEQVLYGLSQRSRSLFMTLWVWGFPSWEARTAPVSRLMSAQGDWTPCTGLSTSISASAQEAWWLDQLDFDDSCSAGNSRGWPTDRSRTWEAGEPSPYMQDSTGASTSLATRLHLPLLHHAVWQCAQHLEWSHWWDFTLELVAISFFFFCSEFCHTLEWNSHGFTCVPHPDPPSHLPLHRLPLGFPSAPGPSACLMHPTWAGDLLHPRYHTCFDANHWFLSTYFYTTCDMFLHLWFWSQKKDVPFLL